MTTYILKVIFTIILVHWFADFVLQTDKQAKGKSKNWYDLLTHTMTYSLVWFIPINILLNINLVNVWMSFSQITITALNFIWITFVCHTITDYFTSRLNRKLWAKGDVHNFFVSVGFDQVLHYVQLFLTFYYLSK